MTQMRAPSGLSRFRSVSFHGIRTVEMWRRSIHSCGTSCLLFKVLALLAISGSAFGQVPTISGVSPQGIAPGSTVDVTLTGGGLNGVGALWHSFPADVSLAPDIEKNGQEAGKVVYRLAVPADVPVGIYGIRVANAQGASDLRLVAVDELPTVAQAAGNTTADKAQVLELPRAVDGAVAALTQNYYRFKVDAGQVVSFEVLARRLGSALDPMIRLLDANGRELAYSDDVPGLRADARLSYEFATAGEYLVEIRDIRYQGGGGHFYRLRVGDFPCVSVPYPMGVQRGTQATVTFAGEHTEGVDPVKLQVPTDSPSAWLNVGARRPGGLSSGFATLALSSNVEKTESEPNDELSKANRVELGESLNGRLEATGDTDLFIFAAKKGQQFTFTGITRRQGSPASLYMRLLNATGGQLVVKEDFGVSDAELTYSFPADGDYLLSVQDLHRRGGPEFAYRVVVNETQPGFGLVASSDTINIGAGGAALVTVTAARRSYNGPIAVTAVDLPAGVTSRPTVIGAGTTSVVLTLEAAADAAAGRVIPVHIVGNAKIGERDVTESASVADVHKAVFKGLPWPPEALAETVAIGIAPQPAITLHAAADEVVFGKNLSHSVKVTVNRQEGFDEAIALAVTPEKNGLPGGITAAVKPIGKGTNEIEVVFSANEKAPLGLYTAVLQGTIKQGKTTVVQPVPGIMLHLKAPFALTATPDAPKVARGADLKVNVAVDRNPALQVGVALTVENLPKGVTVEAATIAADQSSVELLLKVAADAQQGEAKNIVVNGESTVGDKKFSGAASGFAVVIE